MNSHCLLSAIVLVVAATTGMDAAPIHDAAADGDTNTTKQLLQSNPGLSNSEDQHGMTPLHIAAREGHQEVIKLLLKAGADISKKYRNGGTPLHLAALNGKVEAVELLLKAGADANARDGEQKTPVSYAAAERHQQVIDILQKHGAIAAEPSFPSNPASVQPGSTLATGESWRGGEKKLCQLLEMSTLPEQLDNPTSRRSPGTLGYSFKPKAGGVSVEEIERQCGVPYRSIASPSGGRTVMYGRVGFTTKDGKTIDEIRVVLSISNMQ